MGVRPLCARSCRALRAVGTGLRLFVHVFPLYLFLILRFSDVILATILATKSEMCGQKFELKIDNVRFVGHPTLLQHALGQVRLSWGGGGSPWADMAHPGLGPPGDRGLTPALVKAAIVQQI